MQLIITGAESILIDRESLRLTTNSVALPQSTFSHHFYKIHWNAIIIASTPSTLQVAVLKEFSQQNSIYLLISLSMSNP
jgi:hypothetical protein